MLAGQNIVVLDLETLKSAEDCLFCGQPRNTHAATDHEFGPIGWDRQSDLGLSIGCYYDYQDGMFYWFDVHTLEKMIEHFVTRKPLLVGFNSIAFDFSLCRALLHDQADGRVMESSMGLDESLSQSLHALCDAFEVLCATSYDILAEIWKADPSRKFERGLNSLDVISLANGYGAKAMDGAMAPRLWAQGRYAEVIAYNVGDVLKTKALFEQICRTGQILRGDGQPILLPRPPIRN